MLPTADLTQMRSDLAQLLPDTCAITTGTTTVDSSGGWSMTWGTTIASIACRLDPKQGLERIIGGAIQPYHGYVMTLPYNATIATNNRVVHGGIEYNVISVDQDKSWPVCTRVELERIG
jgi:hypothetical protein